jgi:hypothetical protein
MNSQVILPRARQTDLLTNALGDELLVYDMQRDRAHCLNRQAALIWQRCDGHTTVAALARELQTPEAEAIIGLALDQLRKRHLLEPATPADSRAAAGARLTRRALVRRLGVGAALALPVITSLLAPTAAMAGSAGGVGASCLSSIECDTGLVCVSSTCTNQVNSPQRRRANRNPWW